MKNLSKILCGMSVFIGLNVQAQIPVTDGTQIGQNVIQDLKQVVQMGQDLAQTGKQRAIDGTTKQIKSLTDEIKRTHGTADDSKHLIDELLSESTDRLKDELFSEDHGVRRVDASKVGASEVGGDLDNHRNMNQAQQEKINSLLESQVVGDTVAHVDEKSGIVTRQASDKAGFKKLNREQSRNVETLTSLNRISQSRAGLMEEGERIRGEIAKGGTDMHLHTMQAALQSNQASLQALDGEQANLNMRSATLAKVEESESEKEAVAAAYRGNLIDRLAVMRAQLNRPASKRLGYVIPGAAGEADIEVSGQQSTDSKLRADIAALEARISGQSN